MLVGKEIKKALDRLNSGNTVEFVYEGSPVMAQLVDESSKIILSSTVYNGVSYIPKSVRTSLANKQTFLNPHIRTFLTVDESRFCVFLNYIGHSNAITDDNLTKLFFEFGKIAEKWRNYLDENDKKDLLPIRVK